MKTFKIAFSTEEVHGLLLREATRTARLPVGSTIVSASFDDIMVIVTAEKEEETEE